MKNLFYFISFIILLSSSHIILAEENISVRDKNLKTIAHDFLDLEKKLGTTSKNYDSLNDLLSKACKRINTKNTYSAKDADTILSTIDSIIREEGFVYSENFLLSSALSAKKIDCDSYSAIYISIGELLNIPIIPVNAPDHTFIRFVYNDGSYLNWEPITGKSLPDSYYIKLKKIPRISLINGVFLANLSRKEFLAVEYNNIGSYLLSKKDYQNSLPYFDMAVYLYPQYSAAYHNRGTALYAASKPDKALPDLLRADQLDPSRAETQNSIGDIYFDFKEYSKALDYYSKSIKSNPGFYPPYYSIGQLMKLAGDNKTAEVWLKKSEELKKHR